jgi:hypothetical protein
LIVTGDYKCGNVVKADGVDFGKKGPLVNGTSEDEIRV